MPPPSDPSSASVRETNDLLAQQSALWTEIASSTRTMADALNRVSKNMNTATEQAGQMKRSMAASAEQSVNGTRDIAAQNDIAAQKAVNNNSKIQKSVRNLVSEFDEAGTALERFARELEFQEASFGIFEITDALNMASNAARQAGENVSGAFTAANARVASLISGVGTLVGGLFNIGKAVLAIPFQLLGLAAEEGNKLLSAKSSGGGGGDNSFALALEEVRDKLGDIATGEGKLVVDMYNQIESEQKNLAGTGLTLAGVFGKQADALKAMQEMYEGLGPMVYVFGDELKTSATKLTIFQKGLGLSNEEMQSFAQEAYASGKSLTEVLEDTARMSETLGKKFGISSKLISKDLAYMSANYTKFGNMSSKAMGAVSVYVRKLGLEMKALEGVMGVFDDFESGAQASAKLSQAFGIQIDSMKMMKTQNPAEQIDMLRDAFAKSGKSLDGLSRQQINYLAQTTGLGDNLKQALGQAGKGMKLGDAESAAADAASETNRQLMTQSKLLQALATNIKKLPGESGGGGGANEAKKEFTSFIDAFTSGFKKAISESKAMKKMSENIALAMQKFYDIGVKVGDFFLKTFPEIEQIFGGIADIFDPAKFELQGNKLVEIFQNLFKDLKNPATAEKAFSKFFDSFIDWFKGMFNNPAATSGIMSAVETLVGYMGNALVGATSFLMEKLTEVLNALADFISGDSTNTLISDATETGIGAAFKNAFIKLGEVIEKNWPKLKEALVRLLELAFEAIKPYLYKAMAIYFGMIFIQGIVLGIASAMASAAVTAGMEKLMQFMDLKMRRGLLNVFKKNTQAAAAGSVPTAPSPQAGIAAQAQKVEGTTAAAAGPVAPTKSLLERLIDLKPDDIKKAGQNLWAIVRHLIPPLIGFLAALFVVGKVILTVGIAPIIVGLLALGGAILAIAGISMVANTLPTKGQSLKTAEKIKGTYPILTAAAGLMAIMAGIGAILALVPGGVAAVALGLGMVVATVLGITAISYAAGFLPTPAKGMKSAMSLGITGLAILTASSILMAAMGGLVILFESFGLDPMKITLLSLAMLVTIGSLMAIAGLGYLLSTVVTPAIAGQIAIGLMVGSVVILAALAVLALGLKAFMAIAPTPEEAWKGASTIGAMTLIIAAMAAMVALALGIGFLLVNPATLYMIGAGIIGLATMMIGVIPIMANMLEEINKAPFDPGTTFKKVQVLEKVFGLLDPLFEIVKMTIARSDGWFTTDEEDAQTLKTQLDSIAGFFQTILFSLAVSIRTIFDAASRIPSYTESDFKRAELVAAMLDPISNLITSLTSGISSFSGSAEERSSLGVTTKVGVTAASQLDALKDFLLGPNKNGIFYAVIDTLPLIMETIDKMTAAMSEKQIKSMSAKAEMVGKMVGAIGDLAGAFGSIAQAAAALGKTTQKGESGKANFAMLTGATLESSKYENTFVDMDKVITFMGEGGPFQIVFDKLKNMLPGLMEKFNEINITGDPKTVKDKAEGVGAAISTIVTAIQNMLALFPEGDDFVKLKADFLIKSNAVKKVIEELLPVVKGMADMFLSISIPGTAEEIKQRVTNVGSVMTMIWEQVTRLTGVMNSITETTKGIGEAAVTEANTASFESKAGAVTRVINVLSGAIVQIVSAFNMIPSPTATVGTIEEKITAIENVTTSMMIGVERLLNAFTTSFFERSLESRASELMNMRGTVGNYINAAAANLNIVLTAFNSLPTFTTEKFAGIEAGFQALSNLGLYLDGIQGSIDTMREISSDSYTELILKTVDQINMIDEQLAGIENINMNARIEKIGKLLAISPEKLTIDNKPININVQINLTMDAADLSLVLGQVKTRQEQSAPPGTPGVGPKQTGPRPM